MKWCLGAAVAVCLIAACAGPEPSVSTPTTSPASAAASPSGASPTATRWPPSVISGVLAIGATDSEIRKAGDDLQRAAAAEDIRLLYGAAGGLARLADAAIGNARALEAYPPTKSVGEKLRLAYTEMRTGSMHLRTGVELRNGLAITEGSRRIATAMRQYGELRPQIAELVPQALQMQRAPIR
jgi:hypothetical protein